MIDREKVLAVLQRRFPGAPEMDTAAAANAIVGLEDEWREVECTDLRELVERLREGHDFRLLERFRSRLTDELPPFLLLSRLRSP